MANHINYDSRVVITSELLYDYGVVIYARRVLIRLATDLIFGIFLGLGL